MNQENIENLLNRAMYGRLATKETGYTYIATLCFLYYLCWICLEYNKTGEIKRESATYCRSLNTTIKNDNSRIPHEGTCTKASQVY